MSPELELELARQQALYDSFCKQLVAEGFSPIGFNVSGLSPGQVPETRVTWQRVTPEGVETRVMVFG